MVDQTAIIGIISLGIAAFIGVYYTILKDTKEEQSKTINKFVDTEDKYEIGDWTYNVVYDPLTEIMYLQHRNGYGATLSVLYNDRGEPMTLNYYKDIKIEIKSNKEV